MAVDLADDGTLYRPLISPSWIRRTRYGPPLYPVLQAGLMRLGMTPIGSGYLLTLFAMAAAAAGLYTLMRRMRVPPTVAATVTCFAMAANCFLEGIAQIHGDPLAVALELWGLVSILSLADRDRKKTCIPLVLAATCFAFAAAAKVTSIFGIVSALAWLILRVQRRDAVAWWPHGRSASRCWFSQHSGPAMDARSASFAERRRAAVDLPHWAGTSSLCRRTASLRSCCLRILDSRPRPSSDSGRTWNSLPALCFS